MRKAGGKRPRTFEKPSFVEKTFQDIRTFFNVSVTPAAASTSVIKTKTSSGSLPRTGPGQSTAPTAGGQGQRAKRRRRSKSKSSSSSSSSSGESGTSERRREVVIPERQNLVSNVNRIVGKEGVKKKIFRASTSREFVLPSSSSESSDDEEPQAKKPMKTIVASSLRNVGENEKGKEVPQFLTNDSRKLPSSSSSDSESDESSTTDSNETPTPNFNEMLTSTPNNPTKGSHPSLQFTVATATEMFEPESVEIFDIQGPRKNHSQDSDTLHIEEVVIKEEVPDETLTIDINQVRFLHQNVSSPEGTSGSGNYGSETEGHSENDTSMTSRSENDSETETFDDIESQDSNTAEKGEELQGNNHNDKNPSRCDKCKQVFPDKAQLAYHIETFHPKPRVEYKCSTCNKTFKRRSHYVEHKQREMGAKEFICDVEGCNKAFGMKNDLNKHKRRVHPTQEDKQRYLNEFTCKICGKMFKAAQDFRAHMATHGDGEYFCEVCGKVFSQESHLIRHIPVHNEDRPFPCPEEGCNASYLTVHYLTRHLGSYHGHPDMHSGTTWTCESCSKVFQKKINFEVHIKRCSNGEFKCEKCQRTFRSLTGLGNHRRTDTCTKFSKEHLRRLQKDGINLPKEDDDDSDTI